jgi:hypothetical protein
MRKIVCRCSCENNATAFSESFPLGERGPRGYGAMLVETNRTKERRAISQFTRFGAEIKAWISGGFADLVPSVNVNNPDPILLFLHHF